MKLPFIKLLNTEKAKSFKQRYPIAFSMLQDICMLAEVGTDKDGITSNKATITASLMKLSLSDYRKGLKQLIDNGMISEVGSTKGNGGGTIVSVISTEVVDITLQKTKFEKTQKSDYQMMSEHLANIKSSFENHLKSKSLILENSVKHSLSSICNDNETLETVTKNICLILEQHLANIPLFNRDINKEDIKENNTVVVPTTFQNSLETIDTALNKKSKSKNSYAADFESFWLVYPDRNGKKGNKVLSATQFEKIVETKKASPADLIRAAQNYKEYLISTAKPNFQQQPKDAERFLKNKDYESYFQKQDQPTSATGLSWQGTALKEKIVFTQKVNGEVKSWDYGVYLRACLKNPAVIDNLQIPYNAKYKAVNKSELNELADFLKDTEYSHCN